MLFDISTNQQFFVPDWAEQQMREDFPDFFNGKSVRIKIKESKMRKNYKVASNSHDSEPRLFIEPPRGNSRKAQGIIIDPEFGDQIHLQYSTQPPRQDRNGLGFSYPSNRVVISHGMVIPPTQKDLLFYVHYMCPIIEGNKCAFPSPDQWYEYDRPSVTAKAKIDKAREDRDLENLIYFDTPYSTILKAIEGLAMRNQENEEQNRVALHDAIKTGSETFRRNAFEILGTSKPKRTEVVAEKTQETVHELINRLSEENLIKNMDGKWYIRDRRGDGTKFLKNAFFESSGDDAVFTLIDHLKVNEELLGKLRKL